MASQAPAAERVLPNHCPQSPCHRLSSSDDGSAPKRPAGDGYEIDLLLDIGRERWAIEVKLTSDPSPHDLERLGKCAQMVGATRAFLVSRVRRDAGRGARVSCGLDRMLLELAAAG
jgi:hypothetical protein